ncbi:MAG: putative lipid flippase MurJ [Candidatus Doudnabacteria bacterium]|nr:putative lipid flippase MurJ [Candidatus Doudnabacteria bacterium]
MQINNKSSIYKAATILAVFTLLSRLVGLFRDRLFASTFGAGDVLDSYYVAFRIPDLVFNLLILGTLSVAFIPVFTEYFIKDQDEANDIANTVLSVTFVGMSIICAVLFFIVPEITRLTAPGFSGVKFDNTVMLTRLFLISPILFTISNVFGSVLNSLKRFVLVSLAPIIYNFGIILGIVFFYPRYGIMGLGYGVVIGAVLHLVVQMLGALSAGFVLKPSWNIHHVGVKKIVKLFIPRIFGIDNAQMSLLIAGIIGSLLASGTVAIFNLANNLQAVAIGMFGISFAIAAFPDLSESFAKGDNLLFNKIFLKTAINILFFVIPISILIILLRAQIIRLVLGAGHFDWEATKLTANALGIFAISIFAQSISPLFSRAFYARQNTVTPVLIGLSTLALNAVLSFFFAKTYGAMGLVIGFSISNIVNAAALFIFLRKHLSDFDDKYLFKVLSKIIMASVLLGIGTYAAAHLFSIFFNLDSTLKVLAQAVVAGGFGLVVFLGAALAFGIEEARTAVSIVKRKILG